MTENLTARFDDLFTLEARTCRVRLSDQSHYTQKASMRRFSATCGTALFSCLLAATAASAQDPPALNVEFISELKLNRPTTRLGVAPTSDIYVAGDYAYIGTFAVDDHELYIVDVSDPSQMTLAATVPIIGTAHDVKVAGDIAVVSGHPTDKGPGGITVIDVSDPRNPQILSKFTQPCGEGVHNAFLHANRAYLAHSSCFGITIVDLSDPSNPAITGSWLNSNDRFSNIIHDIFILDDIAYISDIVEEFGGLVIADVSDPDHIETRSNVFAPEGIHRAAAGGDFAYYNAEFNPNAFMHIADVSDPSNPIEVGRFRSEDFVTGSFMGSHNPWVQDGLLYWGYYDSGLRIFDLFDPADPVEIGYYVTGQAWGVQPYRDGIVLISENTLSGVRAVRFTPPSQAIRHLSMSQRSIVSGGEAPHDLEVTALTEPFPGVSAGNIAEIILSVPQLQGQPSFPMEDQGGGRYVGHLQIPADVSIGRYGLRVRLEDEHGSTYPRKTSFTVFPPMDLHISADGLDSTWEQTALFSADINYEETTEVFSGISSVGIDGNGFNVQWSTPDPIPAIAFTSLAFAFHPGDTEPGR